MNKCPFWSTDKAKIECNDECPMNNFFSIDDNCPFKEYLTHDKLEFKDIDKVDYNSNETKISMDFLSGLNK